MTPSVLCSIVLIILLLAPQPAGSADIDQIAAELASLKGTVDKLAKNTFRGCPPDFTYIPQVHGCYMVMKQRHNWMYAGVTCRKVHRDAHLLVINDDAEQRAIINLMGQKFSADSSLNRCRFDDWSGIALWTAGQRVDPWSQTPFVWKVNLPDGSGTVVTHMAYTRWIQGQPDFFKGESCLNILQNHNYAWNDGGCSVTLCSVCEIDL